MPSFIDLTGRKFDLLTVNKRTENDTRNHVRWECTCACGTVCIILASALRSGRRSCVACAKQPTKTQLPENFKEIEAAYGARLIPLTHGLYAIVDHEDYDRVANYSWTINTGGYATTWIKRDGKREKISMHRFIFDLKPNVKPRIEVDHKDTVAKLDNRRSNIRLCTSEQNKGNIRRRSSSKQPYKGVEFSPRSTQHPWFAYISYQSRKIHLGSFSTVTEAALAYNQAAIEKYGEFARLNEVSE